jgi:hypothetical protein
MAPPEQRQPVADFRLYRIDHVVKFSEGESTRVVSDILRPAGGWSWTGKRPTVKIPLRGGLRVHYQIDFAVAEETFRKTGPVNVTFLINGHALETVRYAAPGPRHFEKTIPTGWLQMENMVAAEVDKVWTSPDDGVQLGLILNRMGLVEQ